MYVRNPADGIRVHGADNNITGARKPRSSNLCTTRSLSPLPKSSWLKGLMAFADLSMFAHSYHYRTYAITRKNKWIAGILYTALTVQFGHGVHTFVRAAVSPGQYFRSVIRTFRLRLFSSAAVASTIPLDPYHFCLTSAGDVAIIIQISLSLAFGNRFITLPDSSNHRIKPPVRPLRHRSFRVCYRASAAHKIYALRDEYAMSSQCNQ